MSETSLDRRSVETLHGVGPQLAIELQKLGLYSIQDLLFHLPLRYIDRTQITPIGGIQPMTEVVIEGEVRASDVMFGRRRSLVCRLQDHTGVVTLRFFHFNRAQQDRLKPGVRLRCFGEVRRGKSGVELYHPEYQYLDQANPPQLEDKLTPIYPATEALLRAVFATSVVRHWLCWKITAFENCCPKILPKICAKSWPTHYPKRCVYSITHRRVPHLIYSQKANILPSNVWPPKN